MDESEGPGRPITGKGREETEDISVKIAGTVRVAEIWHSPKLRARQTAEILAKALGSPLKEIDGMKPLDDPRIAAHMVGDAKGSVMLVGHLPHLNSLASLLVCGDENADVVSFRNSGVVCMIKEDKWRLKWIALPGRL